METPGNVGNCPMRGPATENRAVSAATARSEPAMSWQPAAAADAWTWAMIGCGMRRIASIISALAVKNWFTQPKSSECISRRLCPELNTLPSDAKMTARMSQLPARSSKIWRRRTIAS